MKKVFFFFVFIVPYFCFADCTQPSFCNRACWDPSGTHPAQSNPTQTTPTHIIVHHTGDGVIFPTNTNYAAKVRFYWDLHVNTNGWSDIGYNWLIDRNGVIYEGRGDGIQGAHFSGMNGGTMGVALIGDFTLESPSTNAINSLEDLIAWEATDKNINVTGTSYHSSSGLTLNNVSGHLDSGSGTVCPGDLYNLLPSIRTSVSNFSCYGGGGTDHPDLVIENLWTVPSNPTAGENVDLYVEIKNVGNGTANSISLDYKINNGTIGSDSHSSLAPNATRTEYYNNYVFSSDDTYSYCVYIDPVTDEQSTANNSYCVNVSVGGGTDDIEVSNTTVNPMTVNAGGSIDVTATQSYSGSQLDSDLPSFDLDYYLSTDCNLSSNDILLGGDISSLGSDDPSHNESATLTIPSSTSAGTYYIIFSADNDNELDEADEANNIDCIQITINNSTEDIEVSNTTVNPMTVNAGGSIDVTATQSYSGSQLDSDLPSFDLDYYLSTDCNLSSNDILLGGDISSLGSDDPSHNESATLTIPSSTSAGTYYIIFSADNDNELDEADEANNIDCIQITVEPVLSVGDYEYQKQLKVYPNPTSSFVNILSNDSSTIHKIFIYDLNGRLVKETKGRNLDKINFSELISGLYILKIYNDDNKKAVFTIMKK